MVLQKETRLGLSFGQILSLLAVLGSLVAAWLTVNIKIAQIEVRITELEKGRIVNAENIEKIRTENREDHKEILSEIREIVRELRK